MEFMMPFDPLNCVVDPTRDEGGVFVGNIVAASSLKILADKNIHSVLTVASGTGVSYSGGKINHKVIQAIDFPSFNLSREFKTARKRGNVLVHCMAGISRSSSMTIAYMIEKLNFSLNQALRLARSRRPIICPNYGFMRQLQEFQRSIKKKKQSSKKQKIVQHYNSKELREPLKEPKQVKEVKDNFKDLKATFKESLRHKENPKDTADDLIYKQAVLPSQAKNKKDLRPPIIKYEPKGNKLVQHLTLSGKKVEMRGTSLGPFEAKTQGLWQAKPNYHFTKSFK